MPAYTLDDAQRDALIAAKKLHVPIMKSSVRGAYDFVQTPSRRVAHAPVMVSWCGEHTSYNYEHRMQLGWMAAVTIERMQANNLPIDKMHDVWLAVYKGMSNPLQRLDNAVVWLESPIKQLLALE